MPNRTFGLIALTFTVACTACGSQGNTGGGGETIQTSSNALIPINLCVADPALCNLSPAVQWVKAIPASSPDYVLPTSAAFAPVTHSAPATQLVVGAAFGGSQSNAQNALLADFTTSNGNLAAAADGEGVDQFLLQNGAPLSVGADNFGNTYLTYVPGPGPATIGGQTIDGAFVIAKLNAAGQVVLARGFAAGADLNLDAVGANPEGGLVLAGDYGGSPTLGTTQLPSAPNGTSFAALIDEDLDVVWALGAAGGSPPVAGDWPYSVAVAPSGDVLVAGRIAVTGASYFGCPVAPYYSGADGLYVADLTPGAGAKGGCNWVSLFWPPADQPYDPQVFPFSVAADPNGGVVLGGQYDGGLDLGPGYLFSGQQQPIVISLDVNGHLRWAKGYSATGKGFVGAVVVDPWSNVTVGGGFTGSMALGGQTVSGDDSAGFLEKLDPQGHSLWTMSYRAGHTTETVNTLSVNGVYGLAVDGEGNVGVAAGFQGSTTIGSRTFSSPDPGLLVFMLSP